MQVNPANLLDFPGRSGVPTEIAYRMFCHLERPWRFRLDILESFCFSFPPAMRESARRRRKLVERDAVARVAETLTLSSSVRPLR